MTTIPTSTSTPPQQRKPWGHGRDRQPRSQQARGHIGWVVFGSLVAGLLAAMVLFAAPFIPATESALTGAVLCGYALGWGLLALLSVRFTDQPQRWAWVPAVFMGLGGVLLVVFGSGADDVLSWVWPPVLLVMTIWMFVRIHRYVRSATGRWLLYPVTALLFIASIGGSYETIRAATAPAYPMPGQLIQVGDHRLHISCTGSGSPTVVLQPGGGDMSATMGWIAPAVARTTRVCVYDRPGRGWSDPADPQDATQLAADLHTLLHRANVPGPYVLAGHSFGGLYVLTYAADYPDEVAGMVLIDSTAPASSPSPPPASSPEGYDVLGRASALVSSLARFGVTRLYAGLSYGTLPPRSRDEVRASVATAETTQSSLDEYIQAGDSVKEAAALNSFGHKPLYVVTAGRGSDADWIAKQNKLAALSTNSAHEIVKGAVHEDLVAEQGPAARTAQAIRDVVLTVRNGQQLRK